MSILKQITIFVNDFFLYYIIIYGSLLFISAIIGAIQFYNKSRKQKFKNAIEREYYIPISIIVPAYNEEITIVDTIESLLNLKYKNFEIIVVNDGSNDDTLNKVIKTFKLKKNNRIIRKSIPTKKVRAYYENNHGISITLIDKENGGKSDALNAGINAARNSYFVTIDADSMLQNDALEKIAVAILENNNLAAAGGIIKISNGVSFKNGQPVKYELPKTFLEIIQTLEYDRTFLASRAFFDLFNGNIIISGAFGLFKKNLVINCGGYKTNTVGEDMELVIRLHDYCITNHIPYTIKYMPDAICWTQVPEHIRDLKKQRKRWHTGLFQSLTRHHEMLLNPKYGLLGFITFTYYWIYELFAPIIEFVGLIFMFISYFLELMNIQFMIEYFLIYVIFCSFFTVTTFFSRTYTVNNSISGKEMIKALFFAFIENVGFRQLINWYRLTTFVEYRFNKNKWYNIQRYKIEHLVKVNK